MSGRSSRRGTPYRASIASTWCTGTRRHIATVDCARPSTRASADTDPAASIAKVKPPSMRSSRFQLIFRPHHAS